MAEIELDNQKKLALTIKETIETSTSEQRAKQLDSLYEKWIVKPNHGNTMFDYLKLALYNFNLSLDGLQIGMFDRAKKVITFELTYLHLFFMKDEMTDEKKAESEEKFTKLFRAVIDADNAINSSLYLMSSMTQEDIGKEKTTKHDLFRYTEIDYDSVTVYQSLVLYLLEQLQRKEYRRYVVDDKGMCYQKIYSEKGYDTHAWKQAMTIKSFILDATRKDLNFKMWQNLTNAKENLKAATSYLTDYLGPEFDDLTRDRHIFSFKNGIYITKVWSEEGETWVDQWIPFEGPDSKKIGASVVSCKLFDLDFEDCSKYEDWFDIIKKNCPNFVHVMEYQQWPEEVQRWLCILMGRMLYDLGELDDWQIMIFLLGMAGTGKSTILENIIGLFYESADVGVLGSNIEKKFGISALVGKKLFIGPEIRGDLSLDQAEFQSMVSGETVQVNTKFKTAHSQKFNVPGALAGNETMNYKDSAGSVARRLAVFPFNFKVVKGKGDAQLRHKIQKELAYIMQACNKGYLDAVDTHGKSGIWDILPQFFKDTQELMAEDTNALTHFLKSDLVILGDHKQVYCREKVFVAAFNDHCKESHFSSTKWTSQFYSGPFADFGIKLNKNCRRRYPNKPNERSYNGTFIFGVDVKEIAPKNKEKEEQDTDSELEFDDSAQA